jgi:alpha-L-fucosidase
MAWWRQAKFGMFIHWGIYAVPAGTYKGKKIRGVGEWIMLRGSIPVADYQAYAKQFNPVKYDPDAWAKLAEEAGMRYMVITAKHHDGFALFPSKASKWNVVDATPYGKDLIGPLAKAARAHGLKFGLYYSQAQDWNNPGGAKWGMKEGQGWDPAHKGSFDTYLKNVAVPQVREILTAYQPDVLWWDTPTWMNSKRAKPLSALLSLRPGIITNNRLGGGYRGDTDTPEQKIPATGLKGRARRHQFDRCAPHPRQTQGHEPVPHPQTREVKIPRIERPSTQQGGLELFDSIGHCSSRQT